MKKISIILSISALVVAGCAKSSTSSSNEQTKEFLDSWIQLNHPNSTTIGDGIYLMDETVGTGETFNYEDGYYVMVQYSTKSITGTYSYTLYEDLAKQLGTYSTSYWYGPATFYTEDSNIPVGVENLLDDMKVGGKRTALIPSWLMGYDRYDDSSEYIEHSPDDASTKIYELELKGFTDDIEKFEIDSLETYINRHYDNADSLKYGFYYFLTSEASSEDVFPDDTTITINYIGRLLDGHVFDTSIQDTAKFYDIYKESATYGAATITFDEDIDDMTIKTAGSSSSSSMIDGMAYALKQMKPGESCRAIFYSGLGYSSTGSSNSTGIKIPAYSPLIFDIQIVDEE